MKKSARVTLTVVAAVGLASCGRRHPDPCDTATFNQQACEDAVRSGGYYHHGTWFPMMYHYPYPYYYDSYRSYVSRGGVVRPEPSDAYVRSGGARPGTTSSPGVERGGFGATGAGHAVGAGE
jgi:hypothetical protein